MERTIIRCESLHGHDSLPGEAGELPDEVRRYALSLERAEGGFHGGLWDEGHDVEYTFYGLGVVGLLGVS